MPGHRDVHYSKKLYNLFIWLMWGLKIALG